MTGSFTFNPSKICFNLKRDKLAGGGYQSVNSTKKKLTFKEPLLRLSIFTLSKILF